jgi:hypothetical protein
VLLICRDVVQLLQSMYGIASRLGGLHSIVSNLRAITSFILHTIFDKE